MSAHFCGDFSDLRPDYDYWVVIENYLNAWSCLSHSMDMINTAEYREDFI